VQISVPTSGSAVTLDGHPLPAALGVNTAINLQGVTAQRAVTTGDFVLAAARVQPTVRALEGGGIRVTGDPQPSRRRDARGLLRPFLGRWRAARARAGT